MTVLKDTSLCAIVRDEMINPAGGVVDFVESTVPFVQQAVILDTGSVDGTREKLEELKSKHPNLRVIHHPFEGYAPSRNRALTAVHTRRALVLDADERLTREDFKDIKEVLANSKPNIKGYNLGLCNVYPQGIKQFGMGLHNPRLFDIQGTSYIPGNYGNLNPTGAEESLNGILEIDLENTSVRIKHFVPAPEAIVFKVMEWYKGPQITLQSNPSSCPSFAEWKKYNPTRENYR